MYIVVFPITIPLEILMGEMLESICVLADLSMIVINTNTRYCRFEEAAATTRSSWSQSSGAHGGEKGECEKLVVTIVRSGPEPPLRR
jgi:hypothetical protein